MTVTREEVAMLARIVEGLATGNGNHTSAQEAREFAEELEREIDAPRAVMDTTYICRKCDHEVSVKRDERVPDGCPKCGLSTETGRQR